MTDHTFTLAVPPSQEKVTFVGDPDGSQWDREFREGMAPGISSDPPRPEGQRPSTDDAAQAPLRQSSEPKA